MVISDIRYYNVETIVIQSAPEPTCYCYVKHQMSMLNVLCTRVPSSATSDHVHSPEFKIINNLPVLLVGKCSPL